MKLITLTFIFVLPEDRRGPAEFRCLGMTQIHSTLGLRPGDLTVQTMTALFYCKKLLSALNS